ncbi:polyadenylate-binding 2-like [Olea europaea subsp. europaea]|uniref:Polyadenylate-binding 2-like n=1 Tax=Olea europaea subsp. europaea TaxID=158383 RepID=A0A8S0QV29_OLEEU|nr:polyadenylate-binding 2-like [Olea europaea subsp. europaea]
MAQIQMQHQNVLAASVGPNGVPAATPAPGGGTSQFPSTSFVHKSGAANILIKNFDKSIDNKALHDIFSRFGNILSCKIATDPSGQLKAMVLYNLIMKIQHNMERESVQSKTQFNNVYVKNLAESTTDDDLKKIFGLHGAITSAVVMRDADGKSKCFGFVNFEKAGDAAQAVEALNGKKFGDEECIDDDKLKELFSEFGTVASCKVMRDPSGVSRGSGFVAFTTPEEASRALSEMNGKMVISKPLYVALAQRKEERRARLQAGFGYQQ